LNLVSPDLLDVRLGLQVLALGSMVNVVTGPVGGVVLMAGRSTINLAAAALAMVGMLVPALVLVPAHGANAASLAWAISIVIQNLLLYLYCRRKLSMSPWTKASSGRTLQGVAVVALPMVLAVLVLKDTWAGCVTGVAASCVVLVWIADRVRRAA
jgi:O-antigen/teichoic acid export membrane protein